MVRLDNISFWDYEEDPAWSFSDLVLGLFKEVPADDDSLIIYIQLSRNADFTAEESEGNLIIRLTPGNENDGTKYFCVSNSFFEHQEGTWPDNIDMTPVLCSDSTNRLLISKPFDTEADGNVFMEQANKTLSSELPGNSVYLISLDKNALPEFSIDGDFSVADDINVLMTDGAVVDTPLLLQNGKYLASASDGRIAFSRSYKPEEPALEQDSYLSSEKLWILEPNGRIQNIDVGNFYAIDEASFSRDGRYLAILDVSIENRVLYIYDSQTNTPINLGEEGFGSQTAAFAWSDASDTIYAMTGYSSMQLMSCVFYNDGTFDMEAVEEEPGSEGKLAVSGGRMFFADNYAGDSGIIYEINDERHVITEGVDFRISADGKTMLVLEAVPSGIEDNEQVLTRLKLCDIETGGETPVADDTNIVDFGFSRNGGKVYYTVELNEGSGETTGQSAGVYKFGLFSFDITSSTREQLAVSITGDFAIAPNTGELYFINRIGDFETGFYATYIYELG